MVFFKTFGAFCVGFSGHLGMEVSELLAKLLNLAFGLEMLEGMANGDGAQCPSLKVHVSL